MPERIRLLIDDKCCFICNKKLVLDTKYISRANCNFCNIKFKYPESSEDVLNSTIDIQINLNNSFIKIHSVNRDYNIEFYILGSYNNLKYKIIKDIYRKSFKGIPTNLSEKFIEEFFKYSLTDIQSKIATKIKTIINFS